VGRVRRCDSRCHHAKGTRCTCWCGGAFHGSAGAANRAALNRGGVELLEQNGFKKGETVYIEQKELPLEVESVG
jgi:hypothetical protein